MERFRPNDPIDRIWLRQAYIHATRSCLYDQLGALLVEDDANSPIAAASNNLPLSVYCPEGGLPEIVADFHISNFIMSPVAKLISHCAGRGFAIDSTTLYAPVFSHPHDAQMVVNAGIKRVVIHKPIQDLYYEKTPVESKEIALLTLQQFKIEVAEFTEKVCNPQELTVRINGAIHDP